MNQTEPRNYREENAGEPLVLPEARLADLPERLQQGVRNAGWSELMPVQARGIPYLFAGRDMMIQSRTGSGKTGAYLLPLLEMINPMDPSVQALVLVPTRELAHQVQIDRKSTRLNSSHVRISYAVFCLKKK